MLRRAETLVAVSICEDFLNVREEVAAEYRALQNFQHDDRSNALDETLHCASWTTTAHAAGSECLVGGAAKAARFRDAASALGPASAFGAGAMWTANGSWSECQARFGSAMQIRWVASSIGTRGRPLC